MWDAACKQRLAWVNACLASLDDPKTILTCSDGRPDTPEHRQELRGELLQEQVELLAHFNGSSPITSPE